MKEKDQMLKLNDLNFNSILQTNNNLIIDCFADWCKPCKVFEQIFKDAESETVNVSFAKLDIETCPNLVTNLGIRSVPTIIFIKNKMIIDSIIGVITKKELLDKINKIYNI